MTYRCLITSLALWATLLSCEHGQPAREDFSLTGTWVLHYKEYPSGKGYGASTDGEGTACLLYDDQNQLFECNLQTTPTGLLVRPAQKCTVTLVDQGGGQWLYLEDGDPHPLLVTDSSITIQRMGIRYTYLRADDLYREWGDDMRSIFQRTLMGPEPAGMQSIVLSARERQQSSYIQWLLAALVVIVVLAAANHMVYRRRRRQLWLQLKQIQEVQQNRPQPVRQAAERVEETFFASDAYAALQRRMATGQLMKDEEWPPLEQHLKTLYPGFTTQLRSLRPMSDVEYRTCLLIKLRIPTKDIAAVLAREVNTISSLRKRLYKKVFGREGGARDWDEFILSIGS